MSLLPNISNISEAIKAHHNRMSPKNRCSHISTSKSFREGLSSHDVMQVTKVLINNTMSEIEDRKHEREI